MISTNKALKDLGLNIYNNKLTYDKVDGDLEISKEERELRYVIKHLEMELHLQKIYIYLTNS